MEKNQVIVQKYGGNSLQHFRQITHDLIKYSPEEIIDIIFDCFKLDFQTQEFAGKILLKIQPRCDRNIITKITSILNTWDVSVEQLPWYFAEKFGTQESIELLKSINTTNLNKTEQKSLSTMIWWIQGYSKNEKNQTEISVNTKCIEIIEKYKSLYKAERIYLELVQIMKDRNRWSEGRYLFEQIRDNITLKLSQDRDSIYYLFACIAEKAAKTTYNLSGCSAPYDRNSFERLLNEEIQLSQKIEEKSG